MSAFYRGEFVVRDLMASAIFLIFTKQYEFIFLINVRLIERSIVLLANGSENHPLMFSLKIGLMVSDPVNFR